MRLVLHSFAILVLTLVTQIGGIAYLLTLVVRKWRLAVFLASYLVLSFGTLAIAPVIGRVPLPCFGEPLRSASPIFCVLNRNYVSPDLKARLTALADHMHQRFPGTITLTLDANFPFLNGFPLLPHLSHDDGEKVDLAFYYLDDEQTYLPGQTKSPIGYWAFEQPSLSDPQPCNGRSDAVTLRWDLAWLQSVWPGWKIDPLRTSVALDWLATNVEPGAKVKLLLEPHLKQHLAPNLTAVRFQGCRAARHDDHIHLQVSQ